MTYEEWWERWGQGLQSGTTPVLVGIWLLLREEQVPLVCDFCENGWPKRLSLPQPGIAVTVEGTNCIVTRTLAPPHVRTEAFELAVPGELDRLVEQVRDLR